jgi:D-aspartate ligase
VTSAEPAIRVPPPSAASVPHGTARSPAARRRVRLDGDRPAAIVLGLFETGLAVARGLGRAGIRVIGLDYKLDVGSRSRYVEAHRSPRPLEDTEGFLTVLESLAARERRKPVLMVTSDDFLLPSSVNRQRIARTCEIVLPPSDIIESVEDKYRQVMLAASVGMPTPRTFAVDRLEDLAREDVPFPAIVKARNVTLWRRKIGSHQKAFIVDNREELETCLRTVTTTGVRAIVQEAIPGPDTNHFKVNAYIAADGTPLAAFGLRKIRQCPPGRGFGCLVESHNDAHLIEMGLAFLRSLEYRGVGSAEFKLDTRDGRLKLIELNPRYWQQVALAERCGMNFPLVHYLDVTGARPEPLTTFLTGAKWLNLFSDFDAFRDYRRRGELSILGWLRSVCGAMDSCFAWDDIRPGLHALGLEPFRRLRNHLLRTK